MPEMVIAASLALAAAAAQPAGETVMACGLPDITCSPAHAGASGANTPPAAQPPEAPAFAGEHAQEQSGSAPSLDDIDLAAPKPFPDPLEDLNRISYAISQPIDRLILRPVAMTYQAVVPKPARDGARNAIANVTEPIVFINDMLQLRPDRALRTLARLLINSTIGVLGLFDIARRKPFNLAHRSNGFGNTLGYYGIGPLVYIYLPVLGPTTLRDTAAQFGDSFIRERVLDKVLYPNSGRRLFRENPNLGTPGTAITIVEGLDLRAENDAELRSIQEDSIDPYAGLRANFLQDRAGEIAALKTQDGVAPASDGLDDPLIDPETVTAEK